MQTGPILPPPGAANDWHGDFIRRVLDAFARVTGQELLAGTGSDAAGPGHGCYFGDFALLTHRGDAAATLNYGNARALALWECDWEAFTAMSSRDTAPAQGRAAREVMMDRVLSRGFVAGYSGERVSRTGRRFLIQDATVWRLRDKDCTPFGVAAFVPRFTYL
jgi:hypothetical protein